MKYSNVHNNIKILKILLKTNVQNNTFYINDDFYKMFKMKKEVVNQSLNALSDEGAIDLVRGSLSTPSKVVIPQSAYSYFLNRKEDNKRFKITLFISVLALIIAIISLLIDLVQCMQ